jgi:ATP dependent DNA ligase-like protein
MLVRAASYGFIRPALPSLAETPPTGAGWIHEIKHDGYRLMVRRDPAGVRLLTRNGHDWSERFPLIRISAAALPVRSCLIDGEAACCDEDGLAVFQKLRMRRDNAVSRSMPSQPGFTSVTRSTVTGEALINEKASAEFAPVRMASLSAASSGRPQRRRRQVTRA